MDNPSLLIFSFHDDPHAAAVEYFANKFDLPCRILAWHEVPTLSSASVTLDFDDDKAYWRSSTDESSIELCPDVVWARRYLKRALPSESDVRDRDFIEEQSRVFQHNWLHNALSKARWINPTASRAAADCKLNQLSIAKEVGIRIPPTLISNDANKIREFFAAMKHRGTVAKPLTWSMWFEGDDLYLPYTSKLSEDYLANDLALQMCPMIYQGLVEKDYELRITVLGNKVISSKLHSQIDDLRTQVDSRDSRLPQDVHVTPHTLPVAVSEKLLSLTKRLGLEFAQIDMAVTSDGEYIFFEVNEAGQWLWIEERCPEITLLAEFLKFVYGPERLSDRTLETVHFAEVKNSDFLDRKVKRLDGDFIPDAAPPIELWPVKETSV